VSEPVLKVEPDLLGPSDMHATKPAGLLGLAL
jgi:hypothetical protein